MKTMKQNKTTGVRSFLLALVVSLTVIGFFTTCSESLATSVINPDNPINTGAISSNGDTAGDTTVPPVNTGSWRVTIDLNGGSGLTVTTYTVTKGATFDALSNTPLGPTSNMVVGSYTLPDGTSFVLGSTPVTADITLKIKWVVKPTLDCSAYPNAVSNLATYTANNDLLGVACSIKAGAVVTSTSGTTALINAAKTGSVDNIKILIASGADPNTVDANGNTPLSNAAASGSVDAVKLLIDSGANVNTQSSTGVTPLNKAIASGSIDTVKLLIDSGANVNTPDAQGYTPALNAAKSDSTLAILKYLVETGHADLSIRGADGLSPLIVASSTNSLETVKYLLTQGQDVNQVDTNNHSVLYWAINNSNSETFDYLVNYPGIILTDQLTHAKTLAAASPTNTKLATMEAVLLGKTLTVNEIAATGPRPYYTAFSIVANNEAGSLATNYNLVLNEVSNGKPSAAQIAVGIHFQRNIGTSPINIYGWGSVSKTIDPAWDVTNWRTARGAANVMLTPGTEYILWGMKNGGSNDSVVELKRFTTAAVPITVTPVDTATDTSIFNGPIFTVHTGEGLPAIIVLQPSFTVVSYLYFGATSSTTKPTTSVTISSAVPPYRIGSGSTNVFGNGAQISSSYGSFMFDIGTTTQYWFKTVLEQ